MSDPLVVDRPFLRDVCPAFTQALVEGCNAIRRTDLATEITRVVLPPQIVAGSPVSFSFLAYPVPRLTFEERQGLAIRESELVQVPVEAGEVELELDVFARIGWFYVRGLPDHYHSVNVGAQQNAL